MAFTILFLFFLQLLTNLIESTYAFGLLQTSIPPEVASVLFLFTPLLLLIFPRLPLRPFLLATGWLVLLCRAASLFLPTGGQMVLSGLGAGAFLLFLPGLARLYSLKGQTAQFGHQAALSASAAVLVSIVLRSFYSGNDISGYGMFRLIAWLLALAAAWQLPRQLKQISEQPGEAPMTVGKTGFGRLAALYLSSASGFCLLYFAFGSPAVISRWTGLNYLLVTGLALFSAAVFITLWSAWPRFQEFLTPPVLTGWNLLFLISLALTLKLNQVAFPADSSAFPIQAAPLATLGVLAAIFAALMLLSWPVIFADLGVLLHEMAGHRPSLRSLGGAALLASLFLLVIILAQVFTTVYDYIPLVGPLLRDRFWLVFTAAGVILLLPLVFSAAKIRLPDQPAPRQQAWLAGTALAAALVALTGAALLSPRPAAVPPEKNSLRVFTYNIQQGYNTLGQKDFAGQLELIRQQNPDIVGLQESDTARAAGGNSDVVRYMADRLDMYSYYGPTTVTGTFGIALLSKYPIQNPETFFMYSSGEQTAAIAADIQIGGQLLHILVTHLGNGGPLIQQQQVLQELAGRQDIIAMGDFNFRPDTEQYALTTAALLDAWLQAETQAPVPPDMDINRRIDHVFISPGLKVSGAEYFAEGPSDHPAFVAEISW